MSVLSSLKRILDELLRSDALPVLDRQHAFDQHLQILADWNLCRKAKDGVINDTDQFRDGAFLVGTDSVEHLIENDSQ